MRSLDQNLLAVLRSDQKRTVQHLLVLTALVPKMHSAHLTLACPIRLETLIALFDKHNASSLTLRLSLQEPLQSYIYVASAEDKAVRIMASLYNTIKQLSPRAELHNQVHIAFVLVRALQSGDVCMASKVMHDLHFSLHILNVLWCSAEQTAFTQ